MPLVSTATRSGQMIAGTHPEGSKTPPTIAIADHIIRAWADKRA